MLENVASSDWGVVIAVWGSSDYLNLGGDVQISHITEFGGTTKVPESGTFALLGLVLIAKDLSRRRVRK